MGTEVSSNHHMVHGETSPIEYFKFGAVILSIVLLSFLLYLQSADQTLATYMRWFMGVFMLTFAGFKLAGYKMFAVMFSGYDIVARKLPVYGYLFPFIELFLGLLYVLDIAQGQRELLVMLVTGLAAIGVFQEVYRRKTGIHCACLGNIIKLPLSTVSLVEDLGMFAMAAAMLLFV